MLDQFLWVVEGKNQMCLDCIVMITRTFFSKSKISKEKFLIFLLFHLMDEETKVRKFKFAPNLIPH